MKSVLFSELFDRPLRNGITVASRDRGVGMRMIGMKQIFGTDRIKASVGELVPEDRVDRTKDVLQHGDLLFARQSLTFEGAGKCSIFESSDEDCTWESHLIRARLDPRLANPLFFYYYFTSDMGRRNMSTIITQVAAAGVKGTDLSKLKVPLPPLNVQAGVAEVLGALDDKIAANERILDLRRQFTRSIYRSAPKSRTKPLSSAASFINGRAFTKNATGTGRVVIRIAELNSGVGTSTVWNDIDVDESNTAQPGDLLFAWSGSLTVARWFEPEAIVNQHIFKVETSDGTPMWLVRELLNEQLERFKSIAADKATTMGHIKRSHLDEPVPIPDDDWLIAHQDVMSNMWDLELELELEKRRLARTRDELLPLLMSGKITVKDAEAVVSDAV